MRRLLTSHSPPLQTSPCVRRAIINYRTNGVATSRTIHEMFADKRPWHYTHALAGRSRTTVRKQSAAPSKHCLGHVQYVERTVTHRRLLSKQTTIMWLQTTWTVVMWFSGGATCATSVNMPRLRLQSSDGIITLYREVEPVRRSFCRHGSCTFTEVGTLGAFWWKTTNYHHVVLNTA